VYTRPVLHVPADAPTPHLPAFEVQTRDELAELGASFNSVQDAAVDLAAEQGVLGGVLAHGAEVLSGIAATLTPQQFYDRRHGLIYAAMLALYEKGQPVDEITVMSRLADEGRLEAAGGAAFLAQLSDLVLSPAHVDHYAQLVADKALLRQFIEAGHQAIESAYSHQRDPEMALEEAERVIFAATQSRRLTGFAPLGEIVKGSLKLLEQRFKNKGLIGGSAPVSRCWTSSPTASNPAIW
jgi:replicative DNA helicase